MIENLLGVTILEKTGLTTQHKVGSRGLLING